MKTAKGRVLSTAARTAAFAAAALAAFPCRAALPPPSSLPVIAIVAESGGPARALSRSLGGEARLYEMSPRLLGDPIAKGRFLAPLASARLVVPVGSRAAVLVVSELEDAPLFFVGAALLGGGQLARPNVEGILPYNPEEVLGTAARLGFKSVGVLYAAGYEPALGGLRSAAAGARVSLSERRVTRAREIPGAAAQLMKESQALWLIGDPLLLEGAGYDFIVESALGAGVALIAAESRDVGRGALFFIEPDPVLLVERAAELVRERLAPSPSQSRPKLSFAPGGGVLLLHRSLSRRWGVAAPEGARHRWIP